MPNETIHVKNMVCDRCIKTVAAILCELNIDHAPVLLGEVHITSNLEVKTRQRLAEKLRLAGFELLDDRKSKLVEQVKLSLRQLVSQPETDRRQNLSTLLSRQLNLDYSYLSNLFSAVQGQTIEKYFIELKIEKVKELLAYQELTLSEIADRLGYSSVAHLSGQFKKVTGLTPSHFKQIGAARRKPLDQVGGTKTL